MILLKTQQCMRYNIPGGDVTLATSPSISSKSLTPDLEGGSGGCDGELTSPNISKILWLWNQTL